MDPTQRTTSGQKQDKEEPIAVQKESAGASGVLSAGSTATSSSSNAGGSGGGGTGQLAMESIKVAVRLRPFTEREKQRNSKRCVEIEQNTVALYSPKYDEHIKKFTFDFSYWSHDGFRRSPEGFNVPDSEHPNSAKYVGQEQVFADLGKFLLENALKGYNSALLAYGQTGSGKSYTVSGYGKNEGILPRFARELFAELDRRLDACPADQLEPAAADSTLTETPEAGAAAAAAADAKAPTAPSEQPQPQQPQGNRYEVYFSMLEIYNEVVRDLLAKSNGYHPNNQALAGAAAAASNGVLARRGLRVREHPKRGFFVENLTSIVCANKDEIERLIEEGQLNKSIAATSMNETSSRGHTIYEFHIKQFKSCDPTAGRPTRLNNDSDDTTTTTTTASDKAAPAASELRANRAAKGKVETLTTSVVQLVDLAGSERMAVHVGAESNSAAATAAAPPFAGSRSNSPFPGGQPRDESLRSMANRRQQGASKRPPPNSAASSTSSSSQHQGGAGGAGGSLKRSARDTTTAGLTHMKSNNQQRFKESVSINQSLSALGNCIQVLSQYSQQQLKDDAKATASSSGGNQSATLTGSQQQQPKIPYRDSVLTKLLNRCCLSGNSKVALIATLSPADSNYDDTLSTLRFADRAKQIRTHATINRMSRGEMVSALQRENERLKQILDGRVTRSDDSSQTSNFDDTENMLDNFNGPKAAPGAASPTAAKGGDATTATKSRALSNAKNTPGATRAAASQRQTISSKTPNRTTGRSVRDSSLSNRRAAAAGAGASSLKGKRQLSKSTTKLAPGPEQMRQLVSTAATKAPGVALDRDLSNFIDDDDDDDDDAAALVAPEGAGRVESRELSRVRKSRSLGQGLAQSTNKSQGAKGEGESNADEVDEIELVSGLLDDIELNDDLINNLDEEGNLLSPDSDDSFALPPADERLTNEEKINILNKLLSNTNVANKMASQQKRSTAAAAQTRNAAAAGKPQRPKKAGARQHISIKSAGLEDELNRVSAISSSLKRTNPYLSNLNPDEQLTGMITYIIKPGEMIVGKNQAKCDLLIYGPELRGKHAKLTRIDHYPEGSRAPTSSDKSDNAEAVLPLSRDVFIEPLLKSTELQQQENGPTNQDESAAAAAANTSNATKSIDGRKTARGQKVALFINGEPVLERTKLNHCDRLLFGSNAYFVFIDSAAKNLGQAASQAIKSHSTTSANNSMDVSSSTQLTSANISTSGDTLADLDMVTYDMAHNEVLRKIMSNAQNEAMIREINDYTHRPGTGKKRRQSQNQADHNQQTTPGLNEQSPSAATTAALQSNQNRTPTKVDESTSQNQPSGVNTSTSDSTFRMSRVHNSRLTRSMTIHDEPPGGLGNLTTAAAVQTSTEQPLQDEESRRQLDKIKEEEPGQDLADGAKLRNDETVAAAAADGQPVDPVDESYREKLMEDTYEFAMPVAEANAIAKEMGIKVSYGLKILTGEEQLLVQAPPSEGGDLIGVQDEYETLNDELMVAAANDDDDDDDDAARRSSSMTNVRQRTIEPLVTREPIKPDSLDIPPQLYVHVHLEELNLDFYWSKEKFQERRVKMLELYGAWDVGGKSGLVEYLIEQSKYQGYYMIDPFIDDIQSSFVLVGHAQVDLQPVSHMSELRETFDILDVNDDIVGSIQIEAIACHPEEQQHQRGGVGKQKAAPPYKALTERELATSFIEQPQTKLLGKKFVFLFKILACSNIPDHFSRIMCQYTLNRHESIVRTPLLVNNRDFDEHEHETGQNGSANSRSSHDVHHRANSNNDSGQKSSQETRGTLNSHSTYVIDRDGGGGGGANHKLVFDHSHFVVVEKMDQDVLEFLQHGFLTIQVVGQYKLASGERHASASNSSANAAGNKQTANNNNNSSASSTASSSVLQPTLISTIINSINKYRFRMEQQAANSGSADSQQAGGGAGAGHHNNALANTGSNGNYSGSIYANSLTDSAKSQRMTASGMMNSNSGGSSIVSASATINLFDQQNDDDEGTSSLNGISQENIIDMILTKRKLDRAENQLHYLKRTINIAEHYNKKHIPIKTVKKLLSSYGHELEGGSLEEMAADVTTEGKGNPNKQSNCIIQ